MAITTKSTVKLVGRLYDKTGSGAPTTSTVGELFDVYLDTSTGNSYQLTAIVSGPPVSYTWAADTSRDAEIDMYIRRAETDYLKIRGLAFDVDLYKETVYPDNSDITAAEMVCFLMGIRFDGRGVESEGLSSRSATYDKKINGYPVSIVGSITRYQSAI